MNLELTQRQLALAGIALLGGLIAVAATPRSSNDQHLPKPVPVQGGGWYVATASSHGKSFARPQTNCGYDLNKNSLGVASPTLPCSPPVKIYIAYKDKRVLTQVIANGPIGPGHGPIGPGHDFELTKKLAAVIGLKGTQEIHWRYAGHKP